MHSFLCKRCRKRSRVNKILGGRKTPHVVCELCGARNKVIELPARKGSAPEVEVTGLLDDEER
jgi:hypothetical protein